VTVIEKILSTARPWTYVMDKEWIGAAHGVICILTEIILTSPSRALELEGDLKRLLSFQMKNGNWPLNSSEPEDDRMVQFCHGSPGFIVSLRSLRPHFPNLHNEIDAAIIKASEVVWKRGLLRKDPCLCHGMTGNALAFDDEERFQHFLSFTTRERWLEAINDGLFKQSDRPYGALSGETGRAWVWAIADKGLPKTVLGYNDL